MLFWIFDLDYTLYQFPSHIKFDYKLLKSDNQLEYFINNLPCKKILFTNGNTSHAILCLKKMNIHLFILFLLRRA